MIVAAASVSAPRHHDVPQNMCPNAAMNFSSLDRRSNSNSNSNSNTSSKEKSSSSAVQPPPSSSEVFERTVYVHPLSQIILEYFQDVRSDWIVRRGLDRALTLHRDGSFALNLAQQQEQQRHHHHHHQSSNNNQEEENCNRIWTSYDDKEKKHWLTVHYKEGSLHERFLLQDNLLPSWHSNRKSLPERVHMAVEELMAAVDGMDVLDSHDDDR
jgi:hypothetical protein